MTRQQHKISNQKLYERQENAIRLLRIAVDPPDFVVKFFAKLSMKLLSVPSKPTSDSIDGTQGNEAPLLTLGFETIKVLKSLFWSHVLSEMTEKLRRNLLMMES